MMAGRLSDRIDFQKRIITVNTDRQSIITWEPDFSARAEVQRSSETSIRFTMRYRKTPDGLEIGPTSHRILWENCIWNITSSVHDRKRTMLFIDCDWSAKVEVTTLDSTERNVIDGLPTVNPVVS